MSVFVRNLTFNAGEDFREDLELISAGGGPVDLTGYSAASHMRKHTDSNVFTAITVGITSAADGELRLSLTDLQTSIMKPGRHVYDVLLTKPGGDKVMGVEGTVLVRAGICTGVFPSP